MCVWNWGGGALDLGRVLSAPPHTDHREPFREPSPLSDFLPAQSEKTRFAAAGMETCLRITGRFLPQALIQNGDRGRWERCATWLMATASSG